MLYTDYIASVSMGTLRLCSIKPTFSLESPILCDFRSSKAYLWGLARSRLAELQFNSITKLDCLDAACHALIARRVFPDVSNYFGLDVSRTRLKSALEHTDHTDQLYLADLTRSFSIHSCFDVVVSLNTLSHIPSDFQITSLTNLFNFCKPGSDLLLNVSINQTLPSIVAFLLSNFDTVEPVYFESHLSKAIEDVSSVNSKNVTKFIREFEFSVPNDASVHHQVFLHARKAIKSSSSINLPPRSLGNKVIELNTLPRISTKLYDDDRHLLSDKSHFSRCDLVLFTTRLLRSVVGVEISRSLIDQGLSVAPLSDSIDLSDNSFCISILGLEKDWSDDLAADRLSINRLRHFDHIELNILLVNSRLSTPCVQSMIVSDF